MCFEILPSIRGKRLTVIVDSSAWMQQLSMLKPDVVAKVNYALGPYGIESITLKLGELDAAFAPVDLDEAPAAGKLDAADERKIEAYLAGAPERPLSMLNLNRHRERARYAEPHPGDSELSGAAAYRRYGRNTLPHVLRRGGGRVFVARPLAVVGGMVVFWLLYLQTLTDIAAEKKLHDRLPDPDRLDAGAAGRTQGMSSTGCFMSRASRKHTAQLYLCTCVPVYLPPVTKNKRGVISMILHEKISVQLPAWRERIKALAKEHAEVKVADVTVGQVVGGMRDIKSLLTDVSFVDPAEGIRFRGMSIPETLKALPKARGGKMPLVGGLYYLLMIGEVPTKEQAMEVEAESAKRADVPDYVYKMLKSMPKDTHPMTLSSQAVLALQNSSVFAKKYHEGMKKDAYWEPMLEDSMNLVAKLPQIAAFIYRLK